MTADTENIAYFAALRGEQACPRCHGTKQQQDPCEHCDGAGVIECTCLWCHNEHERSCPDCHGKGHALSWCKRCDGRGSCKIDVEPPARCKRTLPLFPQLMEAS